MIYGFFIVIHIIICVFMVIVILMQASKGKGLAGAFGGMGSMASGILGARGTANFLSKATTYLAVGFFINCVILSLLSQSIATQRSAVQEAAPYQSPAQNLPLVPGSLEQGSAGTEQQSLPIEGAPAPVPEQQQPASAEPAK